MPITGDSYNVCPSMNSLRMEVGGMAAISAGVSATMQLRNFSIREASVKAGECGGMRRRSGSA